MTVKITKDELNTVSTDTKFGIGVLQEFDRRLKAAYPARSSDEVPQHVGELWGKINKAIESMKQVNDGIEQNKQKLMRGN